MFATENYRKKNIIRRLVQYLLCCIIMLTTTMASEKVIVVGVHPTHYFTTQTDAATPDGVFVRIFSLVAEKMHTPYTIKIYQTYEDLIESVKNGQVDIAITGLVNIPLQDTTITHSIPFFSSPLAVLHITQPPSFLYSMLYAAYTSDFLQSLIGFIIIIFIFSIIFILIEKRQELHKRKISSILHEALYWSVGTFTTAGSDITLRTKSGRVLFMVYTTIGVLFITLLTGTFSSFSTMNIVTTNTPLDMENIHDKTFGVKNNSYGQDIVLNKHIPHKTYATYTDALQALQQKEIYGIFLPYILAQRFKNQNTNIPYLTISNLSPTTLYYSYITQSNSPLLHKINNALIDISYDEIYISIIKSKLSISDA